MTRKSFKREETRAISSNVADDVKIHPSQLQPDSSGDTIPDSDSTIQIDVDEDHTDVTKDEGNHVARTTTADPQGGLQVLGKGVKELVQAVQALRHLGVEDLVLPLPKIVVVGDQSTGKSSLIEGMSEIKVPRNTGTCTRCPLEINLTESTKNKWTCKVSLYKKYMYEGSLGSSRFLSKSAAKLEGATRARPLGPWRLQDSEDFHFATITSKAEVEHVLYLAQLATLNPSSPYEDYMPGKPKPKETHQVKFSPNVVRLDISGPELPNLSFYDLPGVINVADVAEEEYLVDLVKNLVKEYISAEDCINLLAIPMTDDPANSSASKLVRDIKAEARTVGCLTKPDRMQQAESLQQWNQILSGESFRLGFGYHVIKNNPDPRVDHVTARREEAAFFSEQEPWATEMKAYHDRFGTLQLQTSLSQRLTLQIRKSLPRIKEQVRIKAEAIDAELKRLPEPLSGNLPAIVMGELLKFEQMIEKNIDGGSQAYPFQKVWNQLALQFRKMLADSKPILLLPTPSTPAHSQSTGRTLSFGSIAGTPTPAARNNAGPMTLDLDSDDDETDRKPTPVIQRSAKKRAHVSTQSTPMKYPRTVNSMARTTTDAIVQSKYFDLAELREIIQDAYIGLPDEVDPKATERMIHLSMAHWQVPVEHFLKKTKDLCENMVFKLVEAVFGHRQMTGYYEQIMEICDAFFKNALEEQLRLAKRVLSWELLKPNTFNDRAMNMARDEALALLQSRSRQVRATAFIEEQEAKSGKITAGPARAEKVAKVTDGQLAPEVYGVEIKAMSTVKGYYDCAYSRFVDVICSSVHCEFFSKCRKELVGNLKQKFGVTEPDANGRLALLLAVNAADEERRAELKKEKETIEKAQEELDSLA